MAKMRISAGISQIGGKFRLVNTLLEFTPYHEFFLSPFCGACWFELNKPRCRYECFNDLNAEIINYLLMIRKYPKEFDTLKQGVFGLVSQEICNRIVRGELVPENNIERAYFFYYLNKLTFGEGVWMVRKNPPYQGIDPTSQGKKYLKEGGYGNKLAKFATQDACDKIKEEYEIKIKGFAGIGNPRVLPTLHNEDFDKVKEDYKEKSSQYRGVILPTVCKDKSVNEAKSNYRDITPKNSSYGGILLSGTGRAGNAPGRTTSIGKAKERYKQAQIKGINPKTTRPYTSNDCGLLSPLDPNAIKRLRYVNLTCYPFDKVYDMFYQAFHVRKGLGEECFIYFDPPYVGTEKYYKSGFGMEEHEKLVEIIKESPFHCLLSIGGDGCEDIYVTPLREAGFIIEEVYTKYSTDANSQKKSKEYLIMNYDINELPLMQFDSKQNTIGDWL